jgi:hypothetical protein
MLDIGLGKFQRRRVLDEHDFELAYIYCRQYIKVNTLVSNLNEATLFSWLSCSLQGSLILFMSVTSLSCTVDTLSAQGDVWNDNYGIRYSFAGRWRLRFLVKALE